ncbi:hypothetical protein KIW84_030498 [Lathyrus oleraceus]|uniref:J domain-containing protein n=1 Tax=Pisum sativum TaxID=3888 RepID=A0A9D5AZD7_PEA|nr:hypothetical protein KIW84_030498 [Pisum sativum]
MTILCPLSLLTPSWESNPTALPVKLKPLFEPKYQHQSSKFVNHFHSFNSSFFFLFNLLQVKQFHPDLNRDENETSDVMIRRVIQAYQILSNYTPSQIIETECLDPFDRPECEAFDLFVNELLCVGKACSNPCVERASHAFTFVPSTGTARAFSQDQGEDYQVQSAVGQCPRSCIHYVTPSQRILLEELLHSILDVPYDTSAEAEFLYSLITKAKFENNRYQKPKKKTKFSTQHVDWF